MKTRYKEAVEEHNLEKVRIMLADELLLDPRGVTFSEMLEYAKKELPDLFVPDKESNYSISDDRSTWSIELISTIKQDMISNFSVEKLELFRTVAMEVGKAKAKSLYDGEWTSNDNSVFSGRNTTMRTTKRQPGDTTILPKNDKMPHSAHVPASNVNEPSTKYGKREVEFTDCTTNSAGKLILGNMTIKISLKQLAKQIKELCNEYLHINYVNNNTLEIVEKTTTVYKRIKPNVTFDWLEKYTDKYNVVEEEYVVVSFMYIGINNNILKLSYNSDIDIKDNYIIKKLNKKKYIKIDENSASIEIDLCKIKYFEKILSQGLVHSIGLNKNHIKMEAYLLVD